MCVRLHLESSEPTILFSLTPDEHPPTPLPCRWPALITLRTLAKFELVWRRRCDVVLFPSCLFEHTVTAVCVLPEYQFGVNIKYIRTFCEHLNVLHIFYQTFIVLKSGWNSTARRPRLVVSTPSLLTLLRLSLPHSLRYRLGHLVSPSYRRWLLRSSCVAIGRFIVLTRNIIEF